VVPGKILIFKSPSAGLPRGAQWVDSDGGRRFAPAFFADLLDYLGATLVVRCDAAEYDPEPFLDRGIAVEALAPPTGDTAAAGALTLERLDRFLALADGTPGAIAIHCGGGHQHYAAALLAAYLVRSRLLADPVDAVSWLAMARSPAAAAPAAALDAVLDRLHTAGLTRTLSALDEASFPISPSLPGTAAASPPFRARPPRTATVGLAVEVEGEVRLRAAPARRRPPQMARGESAPALQVSPPGRSPSLLASFFPWSPARCVE
jgi:hypothetical protein